MLFPLSAGVAAFPGRGLLPEAIFVARFLLNAVISKKRLSELNVSNFSNETLSLGLVQIAINNTFRKGALGR
ncbi:hypothetical protein HNR65_002382 [Desulfosalsimonas propionicica]|uniref:Uncharacterized protein n=1 Tax=Desulfosalsimonas propionicica TaxID=332175 RepID=A0A7W0HL98_9BACT|nr:hypothetical protein [Desulfosalsimonas propionicica]MBA2882048.1 hypothetical protein [Desulfosalsimonas propionicica]